MKIASLPTDIFSQILTFLSTTEYLTCTTASKEFQKIKYETIVISLFLSNDDELSDIDILQKIKHPEYQVKIHYNGSLALDSDYEVNWVPLDRLFRMKWKTISIYQAFHLSSIPNYAELINNQTELFLAENYEISSFPDLHHSVRKLELTNFFSLEDVRGLRSLSFLSLWSCQKVYDVSCLGGLNHLVIHACPKITNVHGLGSVKILEISCCSGLIDISALTNNHTIEITECENIRIGVESLYGSCRRITTDLIQLQPAARELVSCQSITLVDYCDSHFSIPSKNLISLRFVTSSLQEIIFPTIFLSNLRSVVFCKCNELTQLSGLDGVISLELDRCELLYDLFALSSSLRIVKIIGCDALERFEALQDIEEVHVIDNLSFYATQELCHVRRIVLDTCPKLEEICGLQECQSISLINCQGIVRLHNSLRDFPVVKLIGCENLESLEGLGPLHQKIVLGSQDLQEKHWLWKSFGFHENYQFEGIIQESQINVSVFLRKTVSIQKVFQYE